MLNTSILLDLLRRPAAALCALGLAGCAAASVAGAQPTARQLASSDDAVRRIVSRHGLRPMTPAAPASEFTLPDLSGTERSLSEHRGRWVLLTFWATWCGPCRTEMPSLETLHRARGDRGLTVLGVSIDERRRAAASYVESLGLSFPMLWDSRGEVANEYRAASIPSSYLIDPAGRLLAVSRGARDWSQLMPMLDAVMAAADGETEITGVGAPELPRISDPPSAELAVADGRIVAGRPFELEVRLSWSGAFDEYLPHPPRVALPPGVEQQSIRASTSSHDEGNVVVYTIELLAPEPGAYALDPVELRYTPRFEAEPLATRLDGPTVEVLPPSGLRLAAAPLGWAVAALLLTVVLAVVVYRRGRGGEATEASSRRAALAARLDGARELRAAGELPRAAVELARLELELGVSESEKRRLEGIVERARFGGQAPSRIELDAMARRVERALDELAPGATPNPGSDARTAGAVPDPSLR